MYKIVSSTLCDKSYSRRFKILYYSWFERGNITSSVYRTNTDDKDFVNAEANISDLWNWVPPREPNERSRNLRNSAYEIPLIKR